MPEAGLKTREQIGEAAAVDLAAFPALPWRLAGAEVVQVTFEVDLQATLELLAARFNMLPKNYVVAAVVTSEAARDAYAGIWSLPLSVGQVELRREHAAS